MIGTLPPLLDSVVGGGMPERSCVRVFMDPMLLWPGKGLVLPKFHTIDQIASSARFLILSLPDNESPNLPATIKAGYLNCKIRPYIPNPLRCFKCQRLGHSQTSCRGQLTCSRCASVGHSSADCSLEQKCVNCSQPHSSDSKQCPKWKAEKEIQAIKTNRNISYLEARKLIAPQLSQTYAQVAKSSTATSTTQTDEIITQTKCPPLQFLQPLLSVPQPNKYPSVSTLSSTTQADLLPSTSSTAATVSEPPHLIPVSDTLFSTTSNVFTPMEPSSSIITASSSNSSIQPSSASSTQNLKKKSQNLGIGKEKKCLNQ
ncbi:uncharacterized protein TNCV_2555801 [Trichonephila clavipes]|nr:uncharacterized protein TNCV_2555801 [Trichonephila clavipes]